MKKTIITLALIMFVASGTAINIVDVNFDPSKPSNGDNPDINVTVDGQGVSTEKVRYDIVENGTEVVENQLTTYDSGNTRQISYWFDSNTYDLANKTIYEYDVVAVDKQENSDRFRVTIDTANDSIELEDIETDKKLGEKHLFGLAVINWFMILMVLIFIWMVLIRNDER